MNMREGSYLRMSFNSGYSVEGYVYERKVWLKKGLVLTGDGRALIRTPPRPGLWINEIYLQFIDGEQFRNGPWPEELLPWYPFCVDGKWGVGNADTGQVEVEPRWAFCDCFIEGCARFSARGDFSDPSRECYDGAFGMYDEDMSILFPPVFQHLSNMQDGLVLAKKDGLWGILDRDFDPEDPAPAFVWDGLTFAQATIAAMKNTGDGPRYTLFRNTNYGGPLEVVMEGLTSVTVPEGEPWDGSNFMARLIERDGRWGVLCCPDSHIAAPPELSREEAEKVFWKLENREDDDD